MRKFIKNNYIKIIIFIFFLLLAIFIPYVHDDWGWGSAIGENLLRNKFSNYNGRYISNLFAILLTKSKIMMILIFSISSYLIFDLINMFLKLKNNNFYLLILILFFTMPTKTLFQGYTWVARFVNYTLSLLPILMYLYYNKDMFSGRFSSDSIIKMVLLFILGIISSLFVEHLTLYNLILSLFVLIVNKIKKQKLSKTNLLYFFGSIIGTAIMFSNGAYVSVLNKSDEYRNVATNNFIENIFNKIEEMIAPFLVYKNIILIIFLTILISIVCYNLLKNKNIKNNKLKYLILFYNILFLAYNLILLLNPSWSVVADFTSTFNMLISITWYLFLILFVCICIDNKRKFRMLFLLISILVMSAPLLVVNPVGPRCFIPMYLFYIIFILDLTDYVIVKKYISVNENTIKMFIYPVSLVVIVYVLSVYGYIFKFDLVRSKVINKYRNNDYICIPKLPYNYKYLHHSEPEDELFELKFKNFYNLDDNTKLEFNSIKKCKQKNK